MLDTISAGSVGASSLTVAELRLLPLLATHLTYKEIGERLHLSRNTIKSEAVSVLRKLGVSVAGSGGRDGRADRAARARSAPIGPAMPSLATSFTLLA